MNLGLCDSKWIIKYVGDQSVASSKSKVTSSATAAEASTAVPIAQSYSADQLQYVNICSFVQWKSKFSYLKCGKRNISLKVK
jgi:hypothetical protein